jgi:hypothetical protein
MCPRLAATLVVIWCGLAHVSGQDLASGKLSPAVRDHLKSERFAIVTSVRGLPLGVREGLQQLFKSVSLDIADPGAEFQGASTSQPTRRLVAAGCSADHHCLVYYERRRPASSWHVVLFHWSPETTRFEWGGIAPAGLATIDDVHSAVLAGKIKPASGRW